MGVGYDVYSNGKRFCVSGCCDWLDESQSIGSKSSDYAWGLHAVDVLEEAYQKYGCPSIVNVDQGSQFTAEAFVSRVTQAGARISMDGRGSWRDNVLIERLWKTLKYEHVYLHAYKSVADARSKIFTFLKWYNSDRPHSSLDKMTPDEKFFKPLPALKVA